MKFHKGDKVVCIDASAQQPIVHRSMLFRRRKLAPPCPLVQGQIYEISKVYSDISSMPGSSNHLITNYQLDVGVTCPITKINAWGDWRFCKVSDNPVRMQNVQKSMADFKQYLIKATGVLK